MEKDYLVLLEKKDNKLYFDSIELDKLMRIDYKIISDLFDLLHYKFICDKNNVCKITKEIIYNGNTIDEISKILVSKERYNEIKKDIYMFLRISCSYIGDVSNLTPIPFPDVFQMIDYSKMLREAYNEYHLMRFSDNNYVIYMTENKFEEKDLLDEYNQKIKKRS